MDSGTTPAIAGLPRRADHRPFRADRRAGGADDHRHRLWHEAVAGAAAGVRELEDSGHLERSGETPAGDPDAPADTVPVERAAESAPVAQPAPAAAPQPVAQPAPVAAPVPQPVPAPPPPAVPAGETDLTRLKGLGPKVAAMLVEQGIADIAALARLDPAQADAVAGRLGMFAPRMARDRWVEQARLLAAGDVAGFEARFGKL